MRSTCLATLQCSSWRQCSCHHRSQQATPSATESLNKGISKENTYCCQWLPFRQHPTPREQNKVGCCIGCIKLDSKKQPPSEPLYTFFLSINSDVAEHSLYVPECTTQSRSKFLLLLCWVHSNSHGPLLKHRWDYGKSRTYRLRNGSKDKPSLVFM